MRCEDARNRLHEYIYEELNTKDSYEIGEHLSKCECCRREYEELKKLILEDLEPLVSLKENIVIPEDLKSKIAQSISSTEKKTSDSFRELFKKKNSHSGNFRHRFSWYAAACMIFFLLTTAPAAAYYINQNSLLEKYKDIDPQIVKEFENKEGQLIGKSSTIKDITLTVDGIINEEHRTAILFTTKLPKQNDINYAMPVMSLNVITIQDQFGKKYRSDGASWTLRTANEDGEVKGVMYIEPLEPWAVRLNIRVTAMEIGKLAVENVSVDKEDNNLQGSREYKADKYKNVYGSWKVSFYVK